MLIFWKIPEKFKLRFEYSWNFMENGAFAPKEKFQKI